MIWVLAIFGDLLSLIPGVNIFSTIFTATGMLVLSAGSKKSLFSGLGGLATGLVTIGELIPGLSMVPMWTLRVAMSSTIEKVVNTASAAQQKPAPKPQGE